MRLKVVDGTQVSHQGRVYGGGDNFDADPTEAAQFIAARLMVVELNQPVTKGPFAALYLQNAHRPRGNNERIRLVSSHEPFT